MKRALVLLSFVVACSSSTSTPADETPQPDPAADDDVIKCPDSGVSKGPWTLGMTRTSIRVRWEACTHESKGGVTIEGREVESTAKDFVLTQTYVAAFNLSAPPDLPGTYTMHEAIIDGLAPGTCHDYALVADATKKGRFCTAQPDGGKVHFMAIADTNPLLGTSTARVLEKVLPLGPDFTIHAGDIQYYDSGLETWAAWFPVMQPLLSQGSIAIALGNHESEKETELSDYVLRFFGEEEREWESGGIHFFALDTQQAFAPESEQGQWLVGRLAEVSKQAGYRASIVFLHRPFVTCGDTEQHDAERTKYEPIFAANKVALVVQGHMHAYERFDLNGITYVTTGGGGGSLGKTAANLSRTECAQRKSAGDFFHAVDFVVENAGVRGRAIDADGTERDSFTIPLP